MGFCASSMEKRFHKLFAPAGLEPQSSQIQISKKLRLQA
jgi:hypothetical protein